MKILFWKDWLRSSFSIALFVPTSVLASTTGDLPFNQPLDMIKSNFIAACFTIGIILMMASCVMLAFGEWSDGIKRLIGFVFFLSLALGAPTGVMMLFGTGALC